MESSWTVFGAGRRKISSRRLIAYYDANIRGKTVLKASIDLNIRESNILDIINLIQNAAVENPNVTTVDYTPNFHRLLFDYIFDSAGHRINGAQGVEQFKKAHNLSGKMKAERVCGIPSYPDQRGKIEWIPDESAAGKGYYVARLLSSSTGAFNTEFPSLKQAAKK